MEVQRQYIRDEWFVYGVFCDPSHAESRSPGPASIVTMAAVRSRACQLIDSMFFRRIKSLDDLQAEYLHLIILIHLDI
jgi:hypothetical protein